MGGRLNNLISLKNNRRKLRKQLTPAEAKLWIYLQNSQLGEKFRRQPSIGYYILDFYCPKKKLAIELDGSPHDTEEGYAKDKERTKFLNNKRIKVIRFENKDVMSNTEGVLADIKKNLQ
ncbi:MAG: endonuclease domain-containing protein [Patescibacteria group bacterium]